MIEGRLKKLAKHKKKWAKRQGIEAYRLYERDIPEYPVIVDIYKDNILIYDQTDSRDDTQEVLRETKTALKSIYELDEDSFIIKLRQRQKGLDQYTKTDQVNESFTIIEQKRKYEVNLKDYLDSGLFLDHRPMRDVFHRNNQISFLNLFSYTSSVGVAAALGGAQTTNVDLSKTYLEWSKRNYKLNKLNLKDHCFINQDILQFLKEHKKKYNTIFLDPPTFSNSKKMEETFNVEDFQDFLVESCMKLLNEDGTLYFSNNKRGFKLSEKIKNRYSINDISKKTIPEDFRNEKIHVCFEIKAK